MTIEVRLSKESDFEQLLEIDNRIWNSTTTPAIIKWNSVSEYKQRNPEGSQLVALVNGKVAGYLGFHLPTPLNTNQHVLEIDIAVDMHFQGSGVGRSLLLNAENIFKEKGIKKLSLRVLETNSGAIRFYQKCGFREQGKLINEFFIDGKYVNDLLMYKLLE
ncbi:N-acetyltransferase family protein [Metabacillus halosaccharovorans]|uniref:GNAT family N-acetyltransferase n=1 Tax=Metabacillus halosaccharovorans TaxID=930124 RepID=UPI00203D1A69|nr:GNAT family N-acetyltransferase [Metabacillus halosaccharovorans]MCM3442701.1 GNAT family N-acetyltransferase [Metabacillus halosaccharovorans]